MKALVALPVQNPKAGQMPTDSEEGEQRQLGGVFVWLAACWTGGLLPALLPACSQHPSCCELHPSFSTCPAESGSEEESSSEEEEELPQRPQPAAAPRRKKEEEPDPEQMRKVGCLTAG